MNLSDFHYHLPKECIAQQPLQDRAASRMLVLDRREGRWEDRSFRDLPEYLRSGDCLALNNSKVLPSRLFGQRTGVHSRPVGKHNPKKWQNLSGNVEVFLLRPLSADSLTWEALVRPGKKMRVGERISFDDRLSGEIVDRGEFGERTVRFDCEGDFYEALDAVGHVPLPPYIQRPDTLDDRLHYQTVFAEPRGSVAAPTAGLHFTTEILGSCRAAGAEIAYVTLHVGLGTFQPLHSEVVEQAKLHTEVFSISEASAARIRDAERVVAVGTTSVRSIEAAARGDAGETDIFIYPGFEFATTGAMLTNFHLPQSSLLLLVCAFAGQELVLDAYRHAVADGYRFYSYGDCMLII